MRLESTTGKRTSAHDGDLLDALKVVEVRGGVEADLGLGRHEITRREGGARSEDEGIVVDGGVGSDHLVVCNLSMGRWRGEGKSNRK